MKNEEEFLNEVKKCLKENGCQTWRETIPDGCLNWNLPYKVDLIFYRDDFGYVGVEGKNTNTLGSGGIIAKAVEQINTKYKTQTYFNGIVIKKWAILVPLKTNWDSVGNMVREQVIIFLRGFLKYSSNISLLEYKPEERWMKAKVSLDAYTKEAIHIGGESKYYGNS
jgi:hypothetical protein